MVINGHNVPGYMLPPPAPEPKRRKSEGKKKDKEKALARNGKPDSPQIAGAKRDRVRTSSLFTDMHST